MSATFSYLNRLLLIAALPLLMVGCAARVDSVPAAQEVLPPGLNDIQVCQVVYTFSEPGRHGTAVPLGDGRFVTCRHSFPVDAPWIYMNAAATPFGLITAGADDRVPNQDWAIITLPAAATPWLHPIKVDTAHKLENGQTIYLIGFPAPEGGERLTLEEVWALPRTVIRGEVTRAPSNLRDGAEGIIFVKAPLKDVYHGMSGGAAVVWDAGQQRWVLVGIYRGGTTEHTGLPGLLWWRSKTDTHMIVRFPYL